MFLDVKRLPHTATHQGADGTVIDLGIVAMAMRPAIEIWMSQGLVKPTDSFGFALALPEADWIMYDSPYDFVKLVVGWGPQGNRFIANAVRKLRATLRTGQDTLRLRTADPSQFKDPVESVEDDGTFRWGDFPWGGATVVQVGQLRLPCAVSCFKEVEDDFAAKTIGGLLGAQMLRYSYPSKDMFG